MEWNQKLVLYLPLLNEPICSHMRNLNILRMMENGKREKKLKKDEKNILMLIVKCTQTNTNTNTNTLKLNNFQRIQCYGWFHWMNSYNLYIANNLSLWLHKHRHTHRHWTTSVTRVERSWNPKQFVRFYFPFVNVCLAPKCKWHALNDCNIKNIKIFICMHRINEFFIKAHGHYNG